MNEDSHAIFGLNFLQEDKSVPDEITGAYDPEQEVWLEQVKGGALLNGLTSETSHLAGPEFIRRNGSKPPTEKRRQTGNSIDVTFD